LPDFNPDLREGQVVTANELMRVFKCSSQGGMRRAHRTNSLVLISKTAGIAYFDRWEDDVFLYTGMGLRGDQSLDHAQNKTLAESDTNGVAVFLFENPAPNVYIFAGRVVLASGPHLETQRDKDGNERLAWVFPLRVS
jgi:5-methylcytosine-specific restriction enzyme A